METSWAVEHSSDACRPACVRPTERAEPDSGWRPGLLVPHRAARHLAAIVLPEVISVVLRATLYSSRRLSAHGNPPEFHNEGTGAGAYQSDFRTRSTVRFAELFEQALF